MRSKLYKVSAAILSVAIVLTFSCSLGNDSDENDTPSGTFTDSRDGRVYKWVKIGEKTWLAENLNYAATGSKCYGEGGKEVDLTTKQETTLSNSEIQAHCAKSGRLYSWSTAKTSCPAGWHLPSSAEWTALVTTAGGASTAGPKLRSKTGWSTAVKGYMAGTDNFGFSALPGGAGLANGNFIGGSETGFWWTATEFDASNALYWGTGADDPAVDEDNFPMNVLLSTRCVLDDGANPSGGSNPSSSSASNSAKSGTFTDSRDSKVYKWVEIGGKTWMAQNLNYDDPSSTTDVCYENDTENCDTYGRLYDWETAKTSCPAGWHFPSYAEWATLIDFAGGADYAGAKLMSKTGWATNVGTDDFGFSALPSGMYSGGKFSGGFNDLIGVCAWWGAGNDVDKASALMIGETAELFFDERSIPKSMASVRCVQN